MQRQELEALQECTFQPNLHKPLGRDSAAGAQHRAFRRNEATGFNRAVSDEPKNKATGNEQRHLPSDHEPWLSSLRVKPLDGKNDMMFGDLFLRSATQIRETHDRDWGFHVRLSCKELELVSTPAGDAAVDLFAKRFLALRERTAIHREGKRREARKA